MADQLSPLTPGCFRTFSQYPTPGQMVMGEGNPPDWTPINTGRMDYSSLCGVTGWSSLTITTCHYVVFGKIVIVWFYFNGTGNYATATGTYFYVPFTSADSGVGDFGCSTMISIKDNGVEPVNPGQAYLGRNSNKVTLFHDNAAGNWSGTGSKYALGFLLYEKA